MATTTNFAPPTLQPQYQSQFSSQFLNKFSPAKNNLIMVQQFDNLSQASTTQSNSQNIQSMASFQECQALNQQSSNRRFSTQSQIQFGNQSNHLQTNQMNNNDVKKMNGSANYNGNAKNINNVQSQQLSQSANKNNTNRRYSAFQSINSSNTSQNNKNQNFQNQQNLNQQQHQQQQLFNRNSDRSQQNKQNNTNPPSNFSLKNEKFNLDQNNANIHQEECNNMNNIKISEFQSCTEIEDENVDGKIEIDVKPKRKVFVNVEDKKKFVEDYRKKIKTELCKNFQLKGQCKFGDKCSFAHGYNELKEKTHLHSNYKTKPCKQYFYSGYCAYGYRCQYLHSEIKYLPEFRVFLQKLYQEKNLQLNLNANSTYRKYSQKLQWLSNMTNNMENIMDEADLKVDDYLLSLKLKRLRVFNKIEENDDQRCEKNDQKIQFLNDDEFQNCTEEILKFTIGEDEFTNSKKSSSSQNNNNFSEDSDNVANLYINNTQNSMSSLETDECLLNVISKLAI